MTVAIEKWGGLVGGLLGTVPSTIVPAAVGIHLAGGDEALLASMAIVPLGMLLNAIVSRDVAGPAEVVQPCVAPASVDVAGVVGDLGLLGTIVLTLVGGLLSTNLSDRALALIGFVPLFITAVAFNRRPSLTPKGSNPVSKSVCLLHGHDGRYRHRRCGVVGRSWPSAPRRSCKRVSRYLPHEHGGVVVGLPNRPSLRVPPGR